MEDGLFFSVINIAAELETENDLQGEIESKKKSLEDYMRYNSIDTTELITRLAILTATGLLRTQQLEQEAKTKQNVTCFCKECVKLQKEVDYWKDEHSKMAEKVHNFEDKQENDSYHDLD